MKKIILLIIAALSALCVSASAEVVGGDCGENGGSNVKWELDRETGGLRIYGEGLMADYIFNYPAPGWQPYAGEIKSVRVEGGVASLGMKTLTGLDALKTVELCEGVKRMSEAAISGCAALEEVRLPSTLTEIYSLTAQLSDIWAAEIFYDCSGLRKVEVNDQNPVFYDDGGALLCRAEDASSMYYPPAKRDEVYRIPDGLTSVTCDMTNPYLKKLIIPAGLKALYLYSSGGAGIEEYEVESGSMSFSARDGVLFDRSGTVLLRYPYEKAGEAYAVPDGVTEIGSQAFDKVRNLKSVTVPDSVKIIGSYAFNRCPMLGSLRLPAVERLESGTVNHCPKLTRLAVPDGVKEYRRAFEEDVVNIKFPSSLWYLEQSSLGAKTVILPDNLGHAGVLGINALCRAGTATEAALVRDGSFYIPSIINRGGESTEVGKVAADREAEINGVRIPAWRVLAPAWKKTMLTDTREIVDVWDGYEPREPLYVSERDLMRCGYAFSWDAEARTTTITAPEEPSLAVLNSVVGEPKTAGIWSSDIKFVLNGFEIPSLNIGGGESLLDLNAVAERTVY